MVPSEVFGSSEAAPRAGRPATDPETLLNRTARGDTAAFEQLYDAFAAPVYGLARRVVRDPGHAEEVTQEVFCEIWTRASRFDPERGSARSWILRLTHGRAVDRVRSVQAATERDDRVASASVERDVDTVVEAVERSLDRVAVRRCLGTLTELQRESVTLAYYSGYTAREVADLLATPVPTVKTRLRDGLIRLRDCMGVTA
jgi:RNA polymerase sigma-70 factor (ECF subfamily)